MLNRLDPLSLILLSLGLSMDAFSVATVAGFGSNRMNYLLSLRMSCAFGAFHIFMPLLGWLVGFTIIDLVSSYDHWVAFLLLAFVGGRMIYEARENGRTVEASRIMGLRNLLLFSVAVSIDSMAVGLSFYLERIEILVPSLVIGAVTLMTAFSGTIIGNRTGKAFGKNTQIIGGILLILIGIRIMATHIL